MNKCIITLLFVIVVGDGIVVSQPQIKADNCSDIFSGIRNDKNQINAYEILHFLSPSGNRIGEFIWWGDQGKDSCLISVYEKCDKNSKRKVLAIHQYNNAIAFQVSWGNYFDNVWSLNEDTIYFGTRGSDVNETQEYQYFSIYLPLNVALKKNTSPEISKRINTNFFPNPFSSRAVINYILVKESKVTIQILNLAGKVIKEINCGEQIQGNHQVVWDGHDNYGNILLSGEYIYKVITNENNIEKKMLLLR